MKRLRTLAIVAAIIAALGVIVAYQRPIASEPADHNMTLTIPAIGVDEVPVHTGPVTDEAGLRNGVLHVRGTGFPWERDANVYIAGHDLGFPATPSDKVFWNLRTLQDGDKIYLTDANGTRYTYTVYNKFIIKPTAVGVMANHGREMVSLQVCVPHNIWDHRLIVRGELTEVS